MKNVLGWKENGRDKHSSISFLFLELKDSIHNLPRAEMFDYHCM